MRFLSLCLALMACPVAAAAMPDARLDGAWQGRATDGTHVSVELLAKSQEFEIAIEGPTAVFPRTAFVKTSRNGVYEGVSSQGIVGGMMNWLSLSKDPSHLEGKPLAWARTQGGNLNIYHFSLSPSGVFDLVHFELQPMETTANLIWTRQPANGAAIETEIKLSRP